LKFGDMNRIPRHIGVIPDGNRRWAAERGLPKEAGYDAGLAPGLSLFKLAKKEGIEELTFYGFTQDNTRRAGEQTVAFQRACIEAVNIISNEDASLLVVGNSDSPMFPKVLLPYTKRTTFGSGTIKLNFLVNYGWQWDLSRAMEELDGEKGHFMDRIHSSDVSRVDLIIRWGGRRRLSGFLPVQSVYSDFYIIDSYWPDFRPEHFYEALDWYKKQDITLGG
jgi:undecaprenyl diphosphate synthase